MGRVIKLEDYHLPDLFLCAGKRRNPTVVGWGFCVLRGSLTMTYFHTGIRTIIGVESFHGPVRDGKGWDRLAMIIRHDLLRCRL